MKSVMKVVFVIIGTVIGAGFASGKEIYIFFNSYGLHGLLGIIISNLFTGFILYKTFQIIEKNKINSYYDFLNIINSKAWVNQIINIIINTFLLISFFIMMAGFSAYFKQEFSIPNVISSVIIAVLCYITFLKNLNGIMSLNSFLIPVLIAFVLLVGSLNINFTINIIKSGIPIIERSGWLLSGILYSSYNSIILIPILISLKNQINKNGTKISLIVTIIMLLLSMLLYFLLLRAPVNIKQIELPIIHIVQTHGKVYSYLYGFVIVAAIFTSIISAGYGFLENCTKNKETYKNIAKIICFASIFVSKIGFSNLVNLLYPIFGFLGLLQLIFIIKPLKKM